MPLTTHYWTVKRLDNLVRVRRYADTVKYVGDDAIPTSVTMESEEILAIRDLGDYMMTNKIDEFNTEDDAEFAQAMLEGNTDEDGA